MKHPSTDTQRMVFGFSLLLILAILALFIALGKVEERTSYGLIPLLTTLSTLAGGFAQWAFNSKGESSGVSVATESHSKTVTEPLSPDGK